jgi:tetratricopeptide (TPR) repeat protein
MPKGVVHRAVQLYRRRRFSQVIRLLESQIFRFRENAFYYRLLGFACLHTGDLGGAESYLRRAEQLKPQDPEVLNALAAIHLRRGQSDEALALWLQVVDVAPRNKRALRGLNLLRAASGSESGLDLTERRVLSRLLPPVPVNPWNIILPVILAGVVALFVGGYFLILPRLRPPGRPGVTEVQLNPSQPALSPEAQQPQVPLTEEQVEETFQLAKRYLLEYRDNLALREINRILLSGASAYVKEKARLLKTFVQVPDFATVRDPFSYSDVRQNPGLYEDTFVLWKGKVANVRTDQKAITFDFLVGYQDERELAGIVPVTLDFAFDLENGLAVEILGRVRSQGPAFTLEGISLHRLYGIP